MIDVALYAYLIAIVLAWVVAHIIKYLISRVRRQGYSFADQLFMSGGMPSSHSATATAVTVLIGLREGIDSAVFGLAVAFTLIVVYDAAHVRRMAGITAVSVHQLADKTKTEVDRPPIYRGHLVSEVVVGVCLGAVLALVVFFATK